MSERLTKRDWALLGRVFEREIDGRRVLQSKSKQFERLATEGYLSFVEVQVGRDRFGSIVVSGWVLTPRGHLAYCSECEHYA